MDELAKYYSRIDYVFYNEQALKVTARQIRRDGLERTKKFISPVSKNKKTRKIAKPTERTAIQNLTAKGSLVLKDGELIKFPLQWYSIVENTYSYCKEQNDYRYEIISRKYRKNQDREKICADLKISESDYNQFLEMVQIYAVLQAVQSGLISLT